MGQVANVALTDTFQTWVNRTNDSFTNLFAINPTANVVGANSITVATDKFVANSSQVVITAANTSSTGDIYFTGANTDIRGGVLLITSNTNINGTLNISGAPVTTQDTSILYAIALG
jgi:hypothetical protein